MEKPLAAKIANSLVVMKLKNGTKRNPFMNNRLGQQMRRVQTIELARRQKLVYGSGDIEQKLKQLNAIDKLEGIGSAVP